MLVKSARAVAAVTVALVAMACGEDPVGPDFEVIEEVEFAASLAIDLGTFERRSTGVYWKDVIVGTGEEVVHGTRPTITFTGWLADGTQFQTGSENFLMGNKEVISGIEDGILNQLTGGTRRIIVPPNRGFAGQGLIDMSGNQIVPGGAVLVYEITVDSVAVS